MNNFLILISCAVILLLNVILANSARILVVVPTPSISHQVVFWAYTQELARRGHEVIYVTTDPAFPKGKAPANLTEIDVHDVSYKIWRERFLKTATGDSDAMYNQMEIFYDLVTSLFEAVIQNEEFKKIIHGDKNIDLLVVEGWVKPTLALTHVFRDAAVIQMSSLGALYFNYEAIGAPTHPMLFASITRQRLYNLTLWEKAKELYNEYRIRFMMISKEDDYNEMLKKHFGPEIPSVNELSNNIDMLFLNMHPVWEGNVPVPPNVKHIWGIHKNPTKELPQDLKQHLDSSKHGVIYLSFGTNTVPSLLNPEKIQMFIKVFSQLPYDVLWKWDKDELPGKSKNIRISKWFPQTDILRHPKVKLFITQGGLQSTDETIRAHVPVIGIPFLADQWYNIEKYQYHGIGVKLDFETLTEDEFRQAVMDVISDPKYKNNIKRLADIMYDDPEPPMDRAMWWTEYVLRHSGASHLRAPAANISWAQYLELELVAVVLGSLFLISVLIIFISYKVFKIVRNVFASPSLKVKLQ